MKLFNKGAVSISSLLGLPLRAPLSRWVLSGLLFLGLTLICWIAALFPVSLESHRKTTAGMISLSQKSAPTQMLLIDISGSMRQVAELSSDKWMTRFDVMQQFLRGYIDENTQDLIGLIAFARRSIIKAPPTFDRAYLKSVVDQLQPVSLPADDGTAIGYAVLQSIYLLKNMAKSGAFHVKPALIVITDGLPTTHPDDAEHPLRAISLINAAKTAKEQGVELFIVNIGSDVTQPQYGAERRQMVRAAELTGGRYFEAKDQDGLKMIGDRIADVRHVDIEKPIMIKKAGEPLFLQLGLICFILSLVCLRHKAPVFP